MKVDRCVCMSLTFAQLKEIAQRSSLDLQGLKRETLCCSGCGLCAPYIARMLRTGETEFRVGNMPPWPDEASGTSHKTP